MLLWDRDRETEGEGDRATEREGEGGVGILDFMSGRGGTFREKHGCRRDLRGRLISRDFSNPPCIFRLADPARTTVSRLHPILISPPSSYSSFLCL
ncbi:hypothetical protein ACFX1T_005555 [Malus domestica]